MVIKWGMHSFLAMLDEASTTCAEIIKSFIPLLSDLHLEFS